MFNRIPYIRRKNTPIETDDDRFYSWMVFHNYYKEDERPMLLYLWKRATLFLMLSVILWCWYCFVSYHSMFDKILTAILIFNALLFMMRSSFVYFCISSHQISGMFGIFIRNPRYWYPNHPDAPLPNKIGKTLLLTHSPGTILDFGIYNNK